MRVLFALLLIPLLLPAPAFADDDPEIPLIEAAVRDYVLSAYEMAPERIDHSVSPELRKIGYWRPADDAPYQPVPMNFDQLRALVAKWNADGKFDPATARQEIRVLDHLDLTAVARLDAEWGIDYFHLTKFDGQWKIMNVIWQSYPQE